MSGVRSGAGRPRAWRDVAQVMGLPISVALRGRHAGDSQALAAWARVQSDLHAVDAMFSRYRDDSWVSRFNAGSAELSAAPAEVREVLALGDAARAASQGAFDVWRSEVEGRRLLDTDGVVKGWAVQRAARHLIALEDTDVCLGGGGDLVCWTAAVDGSPWQIGIEDPHEAGSLVAQVPVMRGAIATSSAAHRGAHIVDARTGRPPGDVASVTVLAVDLVSADVDATAAFAQGPGALDWLRSRPGRGGLIVWGDGRTDTV